MYPFGLILGILGLVLAGAPPTPIPLRVFGLVCIGLAWWFGTAGGRIGMDIDEAGVVVRGPFSSKRISRTEIVRVGTHKWFVNTVVHLDLRDGRRLGTNLIQGALVTWRGGETRDILAVLQRELATDSGPPRISTTKLPARWSERWSR
jgi:hypothetical protein